ncbi:uncharacterized protein LOC106162989 isoform X2 [Lingula anatina]|uniref:Uncharacterized protein LOC106162989 isoform X1 n=1 Tax=Lingula anatina TaxID=7574 RepID=A0A1S3ICE9_LINAN|nr:uncharacterized protein LOC106162989 isoform X1 [Lingula anatina]XP_013395917.1 uncharacterized protein LOC106162989 isoform X2 [Lingula anatina]|eukprot:XP_013395909.1 uncharacterized protein LOC106162989 isoform X1 [Lingula anatina]
MERVRYKDIIFHYVQRIRFGNSADLARRLAETRSRFVQQFVYRRSASARVKLCTIKDGASGWISVRNFNIGIYCRSTKTVIFQSTKEQFSNTSVHRHTAYSTQTGPLSLQNDAWVVVGCQRKLNPTYIFFLPRNSGFSILVGLLNTQ